VEGGTISSSEVIVVSISPNAEGSTSLLESALACAQHGFQVIPLHNITANGACSCKESMNCKSAGKHPRPSGWPEKASTDEATIRAWWGKWPQANIGLAMGEESGIWALDIDGDEGLAELAELEWEHEPLPSTPSFQTGGGGVQYLFRWPAEGTIITSGSHVNRLSIDTRGRGGQSCVPPSVSGKGPYRWLVTPDEVAPVEAPAWLLDWLAEHRRAEGWPRRKDADPPRNGKAPGKGWRVKPTRDWTREERVAAYLAQCPSAVSGQSGHAQTFAVARAVCYGFDLGAEAGFCLLWKDYNPRCQPPWSEKELQHKCQEADSKPFSKPRGYLLKSAEHNGQAAPPGQEQPRTRTDEGGAGQEPGKTATKSKEPQRQRLRSIPPFKPFPIDALPEPLASFVREAATALGCDPSWIALTALVVSAGLIGNTRSIRLKRGWAEPCILWGVVIGNSGTLKTPALRVVIDLLLTLQDNLREKHAGELEEYEKDLGAYQSKKAEAKKKREDIGPPPFKPVLQRLIISDITIEKVCEVLEDCQRGTLYYRDELSAWFGSFKQYRAKGAGSDCPHYLSMYSATPIFYDRKTGERSTIHVPRPAVSIIGGIQPGTFSRHLTPEYVEAGLLARLLPVMPPIKVKQWKEDVVTEATEKAVAVLFDALLKLEADLNKSKPGKPVPVYCWLTDDAKPHWVAWYNEWAQVQAQSEGELAAAYSKLEAVAARLALLHHVITCTRQDVIRSWIGPESMVAGIRMARWFAAEAARVYSALHESQEERRLRELVEQIERHGGSITARELHRASTTRYPDAEAARATLDTLVAAGLGKWEPVVSKTRGGRPTERFDLCRNDKTDEISDDAFAERDENKDETLDETQSLPQQQ
jgi:hypothetical protein